MLKKILYPPEIVVTTDFTTTYENTNIHCKVTFTIYGQILDVHHYCYDLPVAAQKMLLTERGREITEVFTELFTYYVPLVLDGCFINDDWEVFFSKVVGKEQIFKQFEDEFLLQNSWMWDIRYVYSKYADGTVELGHICNLLSDDREEIRDALQYLVKVPSKHLTNILLTIHLLLPKELLQQLVKVIKLAMTKPAKSWFVQQLNSNSNVVPDWEWLDGLDAVNDATLVTVLVNYYWDKKPLDDRTLNFYLSTMSKRFYLDYLTILWDIFEQINHDQQAQLLEQFIESGITEREINQQLQKKLEQQVNRSFVTHYLKYYGYFKNKKLRPSFEKLLELLLWSNGRINFLYKLYPKDASRKGDLVVPLLQHENRNIQLAAIDYLQYSKQKTHLIQLWNNFEKQPLIHQQSIIRATRTFVKKTKYPALNEQLLVLQDHQDVEIRRNVMHVLLTNGYFKRKEDAFFYLKKQFLAEQELRIRRDWIYKFAKTDRRQGAIFLRNIAETDPDKNVRKSALTEAIRLEDSTITGLLTNLRSAYYKNGQFKWKNIFGTVKVIGLTLFTVWAFIFWFWIFALLIYHVLLLPIWELLT